MRWEDHARRRADVRRRERREKLMAIGEAFLLLGFVVLFLIVTSVTDH